MARRSPQPSSLFPLVVAVLVATALLPMSLTSWVGWFRGPIMTMIAPVSGPLAALSNWLRPGESRPGAISVDEAELRTQLEFYKTEYFRAEQEITQLRQVIEALQGGVSYGSSLSTKRLEASLVATDLFAGTIDVSRGSVHGVILNSVAVAVQAPHHLIGVVTNVGPTVSSIHVLTDRRLSPNLIEALIVPGSMATAASIVEAPRIQCRPVGDGSFAGDIGTESAGKISVGDAVYLDDPSWPSTAQRLMIGRIARLDETERPLFRRVVIRPDFDLMRVRGVVLRIPAAGEESTGSQVP